MQDAHRKGRGKFKGTYAGEKLSELDLICTASATKSLHPLNACDQFRASRAHTAPAQQDAKHGLGARTDPRGRPHRRTRCVRASAGSSVCQGCGETRALCICAGGRAAAGSSSAHRCLRGCRSTPRRSPVEYALPRRARASAGSRRAPLPASLFGHWLARELWLRAQPLGPFSPSTTLCGVPNPTPPCPCR